MVFCRISFVDRLSLIALILLKVELSFFYSIFYCIINLYIRLIQLYSLVYCIFLNFCKTENAVLKEIYYYILVKFSFLFIIYIPSFL